MDHNTAADVLVDVFLDQILQGQHVINSVNTSIDQVADIIAILLLLHLVNFLANQEGQNCSQKIYTTIFSLILDNLGIDEFTILLETILELTRQQ